MARSAESFKATSVIDPSSATPIALKDAYYNAIKTADYILVTNPWRVISYLRHQLGARNS